MISIHWPTKVISINKIDMTQIQVNPVPIYELDLNAFRLKLKDLEDDPEGIVFLKTHNHNPPLNVGGVSLARTVELVNEYVVEFEDDQYAVNLVGANSNVGDRINVNQVSVRSANSAGLISNAQIEYASFNGGVTIDVIEGVIGTIFPTGTPLRPVNNLSDALIIATYRGFKTIYILNNMTLDSGTDISEFTILGRSHVLTNVVMDTATDCSNVTIKNCNISGILDGGTHIEDCVIGDVDYVNGHIHNSGLEGTITLSGNEDALISNCFAINSLTIPVINMGDSGQDLAMPNFSGLVTITNMSGSNYCGVGLNAGEVTTDSNTVTSGTLHVSGVGELVDELGNNILTGTWNGGVTVYNTLVNQATMSEGVWDYTIGDTTAYIMLKEVWNMTGGDRIITNNREYFYDSSGDTMMVFTLLDESGDSTDTNIYRRIKEFPAP